MVEEAEIEIIGDHEEESEAQEGVLVPVEEEAFSPREGEIAEGALVPVPEMAPAPVAPAGQDDWGRIFHLAQLGALGGLFPGDTEESLVAKAMVGRALGLSPESSFMNLKLIRDQVNISAELQRALAHRAGYLIRCLKSDHLECQLELVVAATGEVLGQAGFTRDEAQVAGLLRSNAWASYPADMLYARATTRLISRFCAHILYWACGDHTL